MTIEEKSGSDKLLLYIKGRIDSNTAPQLQSLISDKLDGVENLTLDFSEVKYISSAGLRVLISAYNDLKEREGTVTIKGANDDVEEVLFITGLETFLNVEGAHRKRHRKGHRKGNEPQIDEDDKNTADSDTEQSGGEEDNDAFQEVQGG